MRDMRSLRSWLFVSTIDMEAIAVADASNADVIIAEFEDFTPPERRPEGRARLAETVARWRSSGHEVAVRINPLHTGDGPDDLRAALSAGIRIVAFPKTRGPGDVVTVADAIAAYASDNSGMDTRAVLVPNIETAAGLRLSFEIATAHPSVGACLVASEDMAADLGVQRTRDGSALRHVRERFLVDCVAAGVLAIDCPYTWTDQEGLETETRDAIRMGYKSKSAVTAAHAESINRMLTPNSQEIEDARRLVSAFEAARAAGRDRALLDGHAVEVPTYRNAVALLARAELFKDSP